MKRSITGRWPAGKDPGGNGCILNWRLDGLNNLNIYLNRLQVFSTISRPEQEKFAGKYKNILYTGPFHAWQQTEIKTGRGSYILYYGNLSVNENEEAVRYLLDELSRHCLQNWSSLVKSHHLS